MLIEKEVISPGTYWYTEEGTGLPRKLVVTPELAKHWNDQGNAMLSSGLTVPVPYEHDFTAHPMTPKDKLLNNAGWVKEYRLRDNTLFSVVDIQDDEIAKKLPRTIRWTSPWINSFTDGSGKAWNNVISHLALTTRPRITKQAPFSSIAAALSLATVIEIKDTLPANGFCLSRAGRLVVRKKTNKLQPQYPMAFSLISGGVRFAADAESSGNMPVLKDDGEDDAPPKKKKPKKEGMGEGGGGSKTSEGGGKPGEVETSDTEGEEDIADLSGLMNPMQDQRGDVGMEEILCDLLCALGVYMPEHVGESEFKRALYEAAMSKIKELTSKAQSEGSAGTGPEQAGVNSSSPAGSGQQNPLIQQEQQPMYMSLEDIAKITDPTMKSIAMSMYQENVKLRSELDANKKTTDSLRDAKLKEAAAHRAQRISLLGKVSPKVKTDLEAMVALPSMALSMGDGGAVTDPMAQTLAVLEKGLADMPRLLTTDSASLAIQPHPTDGDISQEDIDKIADDMARMMGCPPEKKAS